MATVTNTIKGDYQRGAHHDDDDGDRHSGDHDRDADNGAAWDRPNVDHTGRLEIGYRRRPRFRLPISSTASCPVTGTGKRPQAEGRGRSRPQNRQPESGIQPESSCRLMALESSAETGGRNATSSFGCLPGPVASRRRRGAARARNRHFDPGQDQDSGTNLRLRTSARPGGRLPEFDAREHQLCIQKRYQGGSQGADFGTWERARDGGQPPASGAGSEAGTRVMVSGNGNLVPTARATSVSSKSSAITDNSANLQS
jgi:hypothetical protein